MLPKEIYILNNDKYIRMEKHGKYNFNSKEARCIKDNDDLFTKDTLSRVSNIWEKDPWEWLRKIKILKEKKY